MFLIHIVPDRMMMMTMWLMQSAVDCSATIAFKSDQDIKRDDDDDEGLDGFGKEPAMFCPVQQGRWRTEGAQERVRYGRPKAGTTFQITASRSLTLTPGPLQGVLFLF